MSLHVGISCDVDGCKSHVVVEPPSWGWEVYMLKGRKTLVEDVFELPAGWTSDDEASGLRFTCWRHGGDADTVLGEIVTRAVHEQAPSVCVSQMLGGDQQFIFINVDHPARMLAEPLELGHREHGRGELVSRVVEHLTGGLA